MRSWMVLACLKSDSKGYLSVKSTHIELDTKVGPHCQLLDSRFGFGCANVVKLLTLWPDVLPSCRLNSLRQMAACIAAASK